MLLVVRDKEECCGEKRGIGPLARVHYTFIFLPYTFHAFATTI